MLYLSKLMAKAPQSRNPVFRSATVSGDVKWTGTIRNSWASKCEELHRHEMTALIAVLLAAVFLVGMTLGSVLSEPKTEPIQIASMD
jgi:hypothetical protein